MKNRDYTGLERTPSSMAWLIAQRARIKGRLDRLRRQEGALPERIKTAEAELASLDAVIPLHEVKVDPNVIKGRQPQRPKAAPHGSLTKFLLKRLHEEVSVEGLAAFLGTSERSLLRHFKTHYGVSPLAHIQHLRVERAKALLESTHLSFDEVVERCGYSDVSSFRKLFKRATSLTPGDYRGRFRLRRG